jgi:large subunit ribosomal protein L37
VKIIVYYLCQWDAKELPEPVPIQCVMTDGAKFLFSCFQLNTLNYSNSDGVKNFVWFSSEGDRSLYNKIVPKRAMLRNTRYEDYDPDVFRQIVAFYTNGASLSDSSVRDSGVAAALQSQA